MGNTVPVITIDGPSGSGKGTIARLLAERLSWHLLDSGALYRVLGLAARRRDIALNDAAALEALARALPVAFVLDAEGRQRVVLDGDDVTGEIRTEQAGDAASQVAALSGVRAALLDRQRGFRRAPGLVADGRDMGTVVFADAPCKIYLTASVEERARRRHKQLNQQGLGGNLSALLKDIAERDRRDSSRSVAPLRPAEEAVVLDTTGMSVDEVMQRVLETARERLGLAV